MTLHKHTYAQLHTMIDTDAGRHKHFNRCNQMHIADNSIPVFCLRVLFLYVAWHIGPLLSSTLPQMETSISLAHTWPNQKYAFSHALTKTHFHSTLTYHPSRHSLAARNLQLTNPTIYNHDNNNTILNE